MLSDQRIVTFGWVAHVSAGKETCIGRIKELARGDGLSVSRDRGSSVDLKSDLGTWTTARCRHSRSLCSRI